jgi:hypothetical protein
VSSAVSFSPVPKITRVPSADASRKSTSYAPLPLTCPAETRVVTPPERSKMSRTPSESSAV